MSDHYKKNKSDEKQILPTLLTIKKTYVTNELKCASEIVDNSV